MRAASRTANRGERDERHVISISYKKSFGIRRASGEKGDPKALMSRAGETSRPDQKASSGLVAPEQVEPVADRFQAALRMEENKPDFPDLGSPVSPLRPCPTNSSSSSSSSGSASGKVAPPPHSPSRPAARRPAAPDPGRRSHYGELSGEISQRQSGSGPLIFSVGSGCSGSSCTASSPNTNVLPTGNIYPSGKIGKTGMMPKTTPRSDVLGSGTGNYGHGSIMRGGVGGGRAARPSGGAGMGNSVDSTTRRATGRMDPQEVTRTGNEHYKRGQYGEALAFYDRAVAMCPENAACRSNRAAALMGLGRLREAARECEEAIRLDPANGRAHHRLTCLNLRFDNAVTAAEKARKVDARNIEVTMVMSNVRSVARARAQGNELFKLGNFAEACAAYGEGLRCDTSNSVLLCNRAACRYKLGQWQKSVDDCSEALRIRPNYTKALLRRADSYAKVVDINQSPDVAKAENVRIVPTFKIYKNGTRVKEMICPSQQVLEYSVRHYTL
ncbi:hypothetical protein BHM03_00041508 [Ensete ventricosum]|nr:hypothetical protein BHM03_00041508 [Ensete ventricosum]